MSLGAESFPVDFQVANSEPILRLSGEARVLLYHASKDPHGHLMKLRVFGGRHIQTNGKVWPSDRNAREEALWSGALDELVSNGLVEAIGYKGEIFTVTREGYSLADSVGAPELELHVAARVRRNLCWIGLRGSAPPLWTRLQLSLNV